MGGNILGTCRHWKWKFNLFPQRLLCETEFGGASAAEISRECIIASSLQETQGAATCLDYLLRGENADRKKNLHAGGTRTQKDAFRQRAVQSAGPKFCLRLQTLFISGSLSDEFNGGAVFLIQTVLDCPAASSFPYTNNMEGSWVFNYYRSETPKRETLLPEQHICGFVIFKVSKETFQTAFEPWCLTIVCPNWSPVCAHAFAFTTPVLFFLAALIPITLFIARGSPCDFEPSRQWCAMRETLEYTQIGGCALLLEPFGLGHWTQLSRRRQVFGKQDINWLVFVFSDDD